MVEGYLDNAATTPVCDSAKQAFLAACESFGNPSSLHKIGVGASVLLNQCRETAAKAMEVKKDEIVFTSGGTGSNNLAIFGAAKALGRRGRRIVTTEIEHASVLEPMRELEENGFEVVYLPPGPDGSVSEEAFKNAITPDTILVSAMFVNNETGVFLPVDKIKNQIAAARSPALLHVDCIQGFGKYPLMLKKSNIDLASVSAHKIHGVKGAGALYIKKGVRILPIIKGGGQERGLFPGTEPVPAIAAFAGAIEALPDSAAEAGRLCGLKTLLQEKAAALPDVVINSPDGGSAYVINLSVLNYRSEILLHFLEEQGIYVSSGSACSSGKGSHVLAKMGLDRRRVDSALRISFSRYTTEQDILKFIEALKLAQQKIITRR